MGSCLLFSMNCQVVETASEDLGQSLDSASHLLLNLGKPCASLVFGFLLALYRGLVKLYRAFYILLFSLILKEPFGLARTLMLNLPVLKMDEITLCSLPQRSPTEVWAAPGVLGQGHRRPSASTDSTNRGSNLFEKQS